MKKIYTVVLIIFIVTITYFLINKTDNSVNVNKNDASAFENIGLLYMKPGILHNSEFVFIKDPENVTSTKLEGTDYYFEETIKNKDQFVLPSKTQGKRAYIDKNNNAQIKKEENGISAIYEDDNIIIKGLNDDLQNSTLVIKDKEDKNVNHRIQVNGYITQIHYDSSKRIVYATSDWITEDKKNVIYTVNIENGELNTYHLEAPGHPRNFITTNNDELILSSESKLTIFNKNTLSSRYIHLPYTYTRAILEYKDSYFVVFVEGNIIEYDKNFNVVKEYVNPDSSRITKATIIDKHLYTLSPGSFTESGKDIMYAFNLEKNMKVSKIILPKKKAFAVDFKIIN
ncbi:hypothetical protein [Bacillus cereus group sp. BfR-BA-01380]|uniref:hypothetical protein n=1 Tax=Bacillus cereus group sp. BfR-BA-01380 TaxID=2920324 RepID=UPI001F5A8B21|nr:hypothetical protein [Bacillus cereus group sp. BfR-BA-01380]